MDDAEVSNAQIDVRLACEALISSGAVTIDTRDGFEFVSGLHGPVYIDNRRVISFPAERKVIIRALEGLVRTQFPSVSKIAGIATAGIPWAAWIADNLSLPLLYVRPAAKSRGLERQVEGVLNPTDNVLLIEDVITTGLSTIRSAQALRAKGAAIAGAVSIFTYELPFASKRLNDACVRFGSVVPFTTLLQVGSKHFTPTEITVLKCWQTQVLPGFVPRE